MAERQSVKIIRGALDEAENGEIILRGVIDVDSFNLLKTGEYQREVLQRSRIQALQKAVVKSSVPDVDLGMRGGSYREVNGTWYLYDDVFIIDGLQRITACRQILQEGKKPHIGATIHFNTTEEYERDRFKALNLHQVRLSPNVSLRNMRSDVEAIDALYQLTKNESGCVLKGRVCWGQHMNREHLLTALVVIRAVGMLHSQFGPSRSSRLTEASYGLQKIYQVVGRQVFRDNVNTFFDMVDEAWGIKSIAFRESAAYLRGTFLLSLATILSSHENFWKKDKRLFIEKDLIRKFSIFPLGDPNVANLCGSGGKARQLLVQLMIDHINSGKRTRRLILIPKNKFPEGSAEEALDAETEEAVG